MHKAILSAVENVEATYAFQFFPVAKVKTKAIQGAIGKYADCTAADVVALMDTTLFGSGKEGFLFTAARLYGSFFGGKKGIELQKLKKVELVGTDKLKFIYQDGSAENYFASIYAPYVQNVLAAVLKAAPSGAPSAGSEQPKQASLSSLEAAIAQRLAAQKKQGDGAPAPTSASQLVETGKRELRAKRYDAARDAFRKAAEQGDAEAAYQLGVMCHNGEGAEKDDAQAVEWHQKAAEQGHAKAQNALGRMYDKGWGVSRNYSEAFHWYRKAAEQGLAVAQFNVGNMYYHGDGVPGDYSMAREWYQKAAAQGNAKAMYGLGQIYELGKGVKSDETEAVKWYRLAAEKGHEKAKAALERLEKTEEKTEKAAEAVPSSLEEAIARQLAAQGLTKPGADTDSTPPQETADEPTTPEPPAVELTTDPEAEKLLSQGLKDYHAGSYGAASQAFQKAGNLDHPYAWFNLAVMYEKGRGVLRNLSTAFRWYKKAAEAGIPEAQFNVGQMYYLGEGTDEDKDEAFRWYLKAAEAGVAEAQAMVGAIYRDRKDPAQAKLWLQKAADQGLDAAKDALKSI